MAMTSVCGSNTRQFVIGLKQFTIDERFVPPHQAYNLNPDGMLMPHWYEMTDGGGYLAQKEFLLCPTAPVEDYPAKYSASTNAMDKNGPFWRRFWSPSPYNDLARNDLARVGVNKLNNTAYNNQMGTYYYWGGYEFHANSDQNRYWKTHQDSPIRRYRQMKTTEVLRPDRYVVLYDQDRWRNYLQGRPGQMPHERYVPGRTFTYFDGHSEFVKLQDPNNYGAPGQDDASYQSPILRGSWVVRYKGQNISSTSFTADRIDNILDLPTQP